MPQNWNGGFRFRMLDLSAKTVAHSVVGGEEGGCVAAGTDGGADGGAGNVSTVGESGSGPHCR